MRSAAKLPGWPDRKERVEGYPGVVAFGGSGVSPESGFTPVARKRAAVLHSRLRARVRCGDRLIRNERYR